MANEALTRLSVKLTPTAVAQLRQITRQQSITLTHAVRRALALLYYFVTMNGQQMELTADGETKPVPQFTTLGGASAGAGGGTAEPVRLSVKLTPESTRQLQELAKTMQVTMTEVIRRAINLLFYVADAKPEKIEIITPQGEKVTPPPFALG